MKRSSQSSLPDALRHVDRDLLEQLFDRTPDLVFFIKDTSGRYVTVNHCLVERYGLRNKEQLLGRRPCDVFQGDFGRVPAEQDAMVLRTGKPILERLELHWYSPHKPGWCLTTKLPVRNEAGEVTGIIGISKDVRAPMAPQEIPAGVALALRRLERDFAEPVSPAGLARVAQLSPVRFARIIKRVFGLTPTQLISKYRLSAASQMLRETKRSVSEIALDCGFHDHSAFTRAFRTAMGITPTEFRSVR
jgi:AraC-like DNA-binding protein